MIEAKLVGRSGGVFFFFWRMRWVGVKWVRRADRHADTQAQRHTYPGAFFFFFFFSFLRTVRCALTFFSFLLFYSI